MTVTEWWGDRFQSGNTAGKKRRKQNKTKQKPPKQPPHRTPGDTDEQDVSGWLADYLGPEIHICLKKLVPRNTEEETSYCITLPCLVSLQSTARTECPNRSKMHLQLFQLVMSFRLSLPFFFFFCCGKYWKDTKGCQSSFWVRTYNLVSVFERRLCTCVKGC